MDDPLVSPVSRRDPIKLGGVAVTAVSAWDPYVKNFAPNIGHDSGVTTPAGA